MPTGDNGRKPDWGIGEVTFLQEGGLRKKIWEINGRNISRLGEACKSTDPRSSASAKRRKLPRRVITLVRASDRESLPSAQRSGDRNRPPPRGEKAGRQSGDASQALTCQAGWEPERLRQRQVRGRRREARALPWRRVGGRPEPGPRAGRRLAGSGRPRRVPELSLATSVLLEDGRSSG